MVCPCGAVRGPAGSGGGGVYKCVCRWDYCCVLEGCPLILFNLVTVQQDANYSGYYISVGSCTCFGCCHPSSGAGTAVITASGTGQPGLLPSALIVELELNNESGW